MSSKKKAQDVSSRRRRMQQKGRVPWSYVVPAIILLILIVGIIYLNTRATSSSIASSTTSAGNYSNMPFSCLPSESLYLHIHDWLRIVVNGHNITIPAGVGIENPVFANGEVGSGSCFEPVHTHDSSGIIHIESPTDTNYTLGQFFQVWAASYAYVLINGTQHPIVFNSTSLFGFNVNSTDKLQLLVNGQAQSASNFDSLVLNTLAYCNSTNSASTSSPCYATAQGNPVWNGGNTPYPYSTGNTIVIEYGPSA